MLRGDGERRTRRALNPSGGYCQRWPFWSGKVGVQLVVVVLCYLDQGARRDPALEFESENW